MDNQEFVVDDSGQSWPDPFVVFRNRVDLKRTIVRARIDQDSDYNNNYCASSAINLIGIPGIPFEKGPEATPTFYQIEDVVFDAFLFFEGKEVTTADWDISIYCKRDKFAATFVWTGVIKDGIYEVKQRPGYFTIWIPSSVTTYLLNGTYWLEVAIKERVGTGAGPKDRTAVLGRTAFAVEYSASSQHPESASHAAGTLNRNTVELSAPDSPDISQP